MLEEAKEKALAEVRKEIGSLSEWMSEKRARETVIKQLPRRGHFEGASPLTIDLSMIYQSEKRRLETLLNNNDLIGIITGYPIRNTGAITAIFRSFGFSKADVYEKAVLTLLSNNEDAISLVKSFLGHLAVDMERSRTSA